MKTVEFHVNQDRWKSAVTTLGNLVQNSARAVVKQQCKLLVKDMIQQTPPFFTSAKLMPGVVADIGDNPSDRKVGERAVKRDFSRIFVPMGREFLKRAVAEKGNPISKKYFKTKDGKTRMMESVFVGLTFDAADSFWRKKWDRNYLSRASSYGNKETGRWITFDQMAVPFEIYNALLAKELGRVGSQRAGWGFAADALGQKLPGWIRKNMRSQGRVITPLTAGVHPAFRFGNSARGIKRIEHIVGKALRDRADAIEFDIKRRVQYGPGKRGFHFIEGIE